jgi:two-component system chemotaxis response regulator CheY
MKFKGSILLVDDEAHIRHYLTLVLKELGHTRVTTAANGVEAVAAYRQARADLVLLDVNMPLLDGLQTLKQLKEIDPSCVAIMLTSLTNRQSVETARALGARNYLRKDTPPEQVASILGAAIDACFPENTPSP